MTDPIGWWLWHGPLFVLVLVGVAAVVENVEVVGRWADRVLRRVFGEPGR